MTDKKPEVKKPEVDWMDDLNKENIEKVAKLDILPALKIGLDDVVNVKVHTLPKLTLFADDNEYFTMLVEVAEVIYQFNCHAKSFRFQLATLITKRLNGKGMSLIGQTIQISKTIAKIDTTGFKGNAEVYQVSLIK